MPVKLTRLRASLAASGLILIMQPAAALDHAHDKHRADVARSRAEMPRSPGHYDDTPSYDDPSKFGGDAAQTSNPASPVVQVQPRGSAFDPNSGRVKAVRKSITDFDDMQKVEEETFDRRLIICRGC
jgi:hypothetical protein